MLDWFEKEKIRNLTKLILVIFIAIQAIKGLKYEKKLKGIQEKKQGHYNYLKNSSKKTRKKHIKSKVSPLVLAIDHYDNSFCVLIENHSNFTYYILLTYQLKNKKILIAHL